MTETLPERFGVTFVDRWVRVVAGDARAESAVRFLFAEHLESPREPAAEVALVPELERGGHRLLLNNQVAAPWLSGDELEIALVQLVQYHLLAGVRERAVLHAAALVRDGRGLVLAGNAGSGKTTLTGWLLGQGFGLLSDELAALDRAGGLDGFTRPLNFKPGSLAVVRPWPWLASAWASGRLSGGVTLIPWPRAISQASLDLLLLPRYQSGAALAVESLRPGEAAAQLMGCLLNARNLPRHGLGWMLALTRDRPCYRVTYSSLPELGEWLESVWPAPEEA